MHKIRFKRVAAHVGVLAAALALSAVPAVAQEGGEDATTAIQGAMEILGATQTDLETLPVTIPFDYVSGHIVVQASVPGTDGTVPLIVDTGAPSNLVDAIVDAAGPTRTGSLSTSALDGTVTVQPITAIPSLALGDASFSDVGTLKGFLGPDNPLRCISAHGLIGANVMKGAVWQFDYAAREITIAPSLDGLGHIEGAIAAEFGVQNHANPSPLLPTAIGNGQQFFVLDTGSGGNLTVHPAALSGLGVEVDPDAPTLLTIAAGAAGTFEAQMAYGVMDVGVGSSTIEGYPVAASPALEPALGNMGNGFLEDFVVTIDFPNFMIYLDAVDEPWPPDPPEASVSWDGDGLAVNRLVVGGALESAGLSLGAAVASVDGKDVTTATLESSCNIINGELPESYQIELVDGGVFTIGAATTFFETFER